MNKLIATNIIKNILGYDYLFAPVGSFYILDFQWLNITLSRCQDK